MTAKTENRETERPAWAAGLDLSPKLRRGTEGILEICVKLRPEFGWLLRRLADAEMEVARLKDALITKEEEWLALTGMTLLEAIERGHSRVEREEPYSLVDYFTEKLAAAQREYIAQAFELKRDRGEPDFLIEEDGTKWRRVGPDRYQDGSSDPEFLPCREKIERSTEGKLTEVWK